MDAYRQNEGSDKNPSGVSPDGFLPVERGKSEQKTEEVAPAKVSHRIADTAPRLKKRKQFLHVAASGRKAIASTLVVQGRQVRLDGQEDATLMQVGFTVTKKTGNSVVRNRIRRRLRAAVAENIGRYGSAGWDFVVIGRHTALNAPYDIIVRDLRYALRKVVKPQDANAQQRSPDAEKDISATRKKK